MGARKPARRSTYPTLELDPHLPSIFSTQRPHICGRQRWGNSQAGGGKTIHFPLIGKLCRHCGYRPKAKGRVVDTACAVIASGQAKAPTTPSEFNIFHCTYGHPHEVLLKKTAEQQGFNLSEELHESAEGVQ